MAAPFNQNVTLVGPYASSSAGGSGSSSYAVSVPNAGPLAIQWKATIPTIVDGGGASGFVVQITNGTGPVTLFTGSAGACSGGKIETLVAAGDVITFNISSTNANDLASLNAIKCNIQFWQGV